MTRGSRTRGPLVAAVLVAAAVLVVSLAVPALGGPNAVSAVSALKVAKKALKKANQADKRARQALREADKVAAQGGAQGPPGRQERPAPAGAVGKDAVRVSVTYVDGSVGTTGATGYVIDVAFCPAGQAPTGGSFSPTGSELGGPDPILGDYGDFAFDSDIPEDGFVDAWGAWAYNAAGTAEIIASAICASVGRTSPAGARTSEQGRESCSGSGSCSGSRSLLLGFALVIPVLALGADAARASDREGIASALRAASAPASELHLDRVRESFGARFYQFEQRARGTACAGSVGGTDGRRPARRRSASRPQPPRDRRASSGIGVTKPGGEKGHRGRGPFMSFAHGPRRSSWSPRWDAATRLVWRVRVASRSPFSRVSRS